MSFAEAIGGRPAFDSDATGPAVIGRRLSRAQTQKTITDLQGAPIVIDIAQADEEIRMLAVRLH